MGDDASSHLFQDAAARLVARGDFGQFIGANPRGRNILGREQDVHGSVEYAGTGDKLARFATAST